MADQTDPWAAFNPQAAQSGAPAFGGRPVIHQAPPQPSAPSGYRFAGSSLEPIPGGPADPTQNDTLDPLTTDYYAHQVLAGAPLPAMGMGKTASEMRRKVMERVAAIANEQGMGGADLATQIAHYKAGQKQIGTLENQFGTTQQNERTALLNGQQFMDRSTELPGQTEFPLVNSLVQFGQRHLPVPGHQTIAAMDAAWNTFVNEYAKVVAGTPTGGGVLSDSARHEAMSIMQGNYSLSQKEAAFNQMKADMANRLTAMNGTISEAYQNLTKQPGQEHGVVPGINAAAPGAQGQSGAAPPGMGGMPGGPPNGSPPDMPQDQMTAATGQTKEVIDQSLTPVRREYMARLNAGQSGTELVSFLRQSGVNDPALLKRAGEQAAFRRKNPNVPIQLYDTSAIDHITQQMGTVNRAVNAAGQTDLGAGAIAAGNAVLGGYGPDLVGALGGNEEQARLAGQYSAQDHPGAALTGSIVGGTAAALAGEGALGGAGMGAGFGRSLLADSAYGAFAGSGASPQNRLSGAGMGLLAGAGGSVGGQALARGGSAVLRGVSDRSVNALADSGVPLTMGQAAGQSGRVGQFVKGVEDRLAGFSGVGDMIHARRTEGYRAFNAKAFDKALEPIGGTVNGAVGEEAISSARQTVSDAFSAALKGKQAVPDDQFVKAARGPLERLASIKRNDLGAEIVQQIEETTKDLFDPATGALSGEDMQSFLEALREIRQSYKGDPLYARTIKPSVQGIENAVTDMFARQAPEVVPAFNQAKAAYRRVSILADAVGRGKDTEGVFTPSQLGGADRANAKKFDGKLSAASGESPFFDLQRAGQKVLPGKVPDPGTAGRIALAKGASLPVIGGTMGYLGGDTKTGAEAGLGLTGILALAYTKAGQKRIAAMLLSRNPQARALAEQITKRLPIAGAAGTALTQTGGAQ